MKKIACLVAAVVMLCISFASCGRTQQIPLGFYQIDKAQEFSEYSSIGVTLVDNGLCRVDFSMTGDSFSGTYAVKQNTLTLSLDTLFGEYITVTDIDIKYIFEISANGSLIFKEYKGDPIKYTYTITGEEMNFKPSLHFEKGSKFILQDENVNPFFDGTVLEVYDYSILVKLLENEDERKSSDKISVDLPLVVRNQNIEFKKGDKVRVVYNGEILETYPAQLSQVFDVCLVSSSDNFSDYTHSVAWANYSDDAEIYTACLNSDKLSVNHTKHLPIRKFESTAELDSFKARFADKLNMDSSYDEMPSFNDVTDKYDDSFFKAKSLFVVYVSAGSTTFRYGVESVFNDGETFEIRIARTDDSETGDTAMAGWLVAVEVQKDDIKTCQNFDSFML